MPMRLLLSSPQGLKPDGVIVLPDMQIVTSKCATAFKEQTIGESAHAPGPRSPVAPAAEQTKDVGAMGVNEARSDRGRDVSPKSQQDSIFAVGVKFPDTPCMPYICLHWV